MREESFASQSSNNRNGTDPKKNMKGISRKFEVFHVLGIMWVLWRKNVCGIPLRGLSVWLTFSFVLLLWQNIIITSLDAEVKIWTLVHYLCASLESDLLISDFQSEIDWYFQCNLILYRKFYLTIIWSAQTFWGTEDFIFSLCTELIERSKFYSEKFKRDLTYVWKTHRDIFESTESYIMQCVMIGYDVVVECESITLI